ECAGCDEIAPRIDRGQTVACRECNDEVAMGYDRGVGDKQETTIRHLCERFDRVLDIGGIVADLVWDEFNRKRSRSRLCGSPEVLIPSEFWIGDKCDTSE